MKDQITIAENVTIEQRLVQKRSEKDALLKNLSYEERLIASKRENLLYLKNKLLQYTSDGDHNDIESTKKHILLAENEMNDILSGKIILQWKLRNLTKLEIIQALKDPNIAKDSSLSRQITSGMVQKRDEIKGKKLLSLMESPAIETYLTVVKELQILSNEDRALRIQQLQTTKEEFTKTYYKPIVDKIIQMTERAYQELEAISIKKDQMKADYGMKEKAALESLPYDERRAIEEVEQKIEQLDEIQTEMKQKYDRAMTTKNERDFAEVVQRIKFYVEKKKTEGWRYPVVKQLFVS